MKVLIIDDDVNMCQCIAQQLKKNDIVCDVVHLGEDALKLCKTNEYDLCILDLLLPDTTGYEILKRFRMNNMNTPVLILTDRDGLQEKLHGFDCGADDYLPKPFNKEELFARMHALIRRSKGYSGSVINIGMLAVHLKEKYVKVNDKMLDLTNTEYKIVELLALHKGSTMHKEIFFEHIYSGDIEMPEMKIIDVFVCKIRKKIADVCGYDPGYIQTMWGRGYVMNEPQEDQRALG